MFGGCENDGPILTDKFYGTWNYNYLIPKSDFEKYSKESFSKGGGAEMSFSGTTSFLSTGKYYSEVDCTLSIFQKSQDLTLRFSSNEFGEYSFDDDKITFITTQCEIIPSNNYTSQILKYNPDLKNSLKPSLGEEETLIIEEFVEGNYPDASIKIALESFPFVKLTMERRRSGIDREIELTIENDYAVLHNNSPWLIENIEIYTQPPAKGELKKYVNTITATSFRVELDKIEGNKTAKLPKRDFINKDGRRLNSDFVIGYWKVKGTMFDEEFLITFEDGNN